MAAVHDVIDAAARALEEYDLAAAQRESLEIALAAARAAVDAGATRIGELEAIEADLRARLAECEAEEPPPPPVGARGLLGWNNEHPLLSARRWYYRWDSSRFRLEVESAARLAAGVVPLNSIKMPGGAGNFEAVAQGANETEIRAIFDTLPAGTKLGIHHEAEDDMEDLGVPFTAYARMFDRVSTYIPAGVVVVPCFMGWSFDERSRRAWREMIPSSTEEFALDDYNWRFSPNRGTEPWKTPAQMAATWLPDLRPFGVKISVWETNAHEDPADPARKAGWLREWADVAEAEEMDLVFFDSRATQPGDFRLLSSAASREALEEIARRPYFARSA